MTNESRLSTLCPNCRKLISKDEPRCPYCGISHPGSILKDNPVIKGFSSKEQPIGIIIYISTGLYILSLFLYPGSMNLSNPFNAFSPSSNSLWLLGATGTIPLKYMRWWTLVSANYLHGSLVHIIFNMIALKQIGTLVIKVYGIHRMIIIWFFTGIIGYAVSCMAGVKFTIGASAGVCGMIGAALFYGKSRGGIFGQAVYKQISAWVMAIFVFGLMPGINNWGHAGGILGGILTGYILKYPEKRPEKFIDKAIAGICIILTVIILMWSIGSGLFLRIFG